MFGACATLIASAIPALAALLVCAGSFAWGQAQSGVSKDDVKGAEKAAERGDKAAASGKLQEAVADYAQAVKAAPGDVGIARRAAAVRAQVVQKIVDEAEVAALDGELDKATALMREALLTDPGNTIVAERLVQMKQMPKEYLPRGDKEDYELKGLPTLRPQPGKKPINVRGDSKSAYEQVAGMFGITVAFDPDLTAKNVKLRLNDVDFYTAMQLLGVESRTFYRAVNPTLIFVAAESIEKRKEYAEVVEQTFRLDDTVGTEDITEMMRVLREITNSTHITMDGKSRSLTIRESGDKVALAGALIKELEQARRDVMLDIDLLEVDRNYARTLGVTPPSSVQAIPLNSNAIKQLEAATDISNLLTLVAQVFTSQGITASPRDVYPVGGGKSTFLLTMPNASATFSNGLSLVKSGREILLRAQDGKPATFFLGQRFPVTLSLLSTSLGGTVIGGAVTSTVFAQTNFAVGNDPVAVVAQDLNNDAQLDLAVANRGDSSITILLNNGGGKFTATTGSPIKLGTNEQSPSAIAAGIFRVTDATHLVQPADLVIANRGSNTVSVLLGSQNLDGTFTEATGSPFVVGDQPSAVVEADFNGDGFLDFAVTNEGDNSISVFQGDGTGAFTEFAGSPFRFVGPLNIGTTSLPSGLLNAAYATTLSASGGTGALTWSVTTGSLPTGLTLNASTGVISGTPTAAGTSACSVTVTDSAATPATTTKNVSIEVDTTPAAMAITAASLLNGTPSTAYSQTLTVTGGKSPYTWSVASGALPPSITLNATTGVLSGQMTTGNFSFTLQVTDSSASPIAAVKQFAISPVAASSGSEQQPIAMRLGTFDNSGVPEIAVLNFATENIGLFKTSGGTAFNGTFTELSGSPVDVGSNPVAFAAGDLNADGFSDLAIVNQSLNEVTVLLNDGTGFFTAAAGSPLATAATPAGVAIADFTNDGIGDIAVTNNGVGTLGVYAGLGLGQYSPRIELTVPAGPLAVSTAVLTTSGLPDAIVTTSSGSNNFVSVLLDPSSFATGSGPGSVQTPYPGSEYIDLGVKVKATPSVHENDEVTLQLEFEIRALSGNNVNGIPIITNRTISQTVRLKEGEPSVIAGLLDQEETKSLNGIPGFANLPGVGYAFGQRNTTSTDTELLIVVTPRRMSDRVRQARTRYAGRGGATSLGGPPPASVPTPAPEP
jgi:hypothetical protein